MPTGIYKHKPCLKETKKKISEAQSKEKGYWFGKILSEEHKRNMRKPRSEEAKANMKGKCGVYIRTEETRKKISQRNKGKYASI